MVHKTLDFNYFSHRFDSIWITKGGEQILLSSLPPSRILNMSTQPQKNHGEEAYVRIMGDLKELDFRGEAVPCALVLIGDHAFPLAINSQGHVLMAASLYGQGKIVVMGHEVYLTAFPDLVENAVTWLSGGKTANMSVQVHKSVNRVADSLRKTSFQVEMVGGFIGNMESGVYVSNAYSVGKDVKDLVAFMKAGGGVLIAGQAWSWAQSHPKENTLLSFDGNKISSLAGIYFSDHYARAEHVPVYPQIPSSWMNVV